MHGSLVYDITVFENINNNIVEDSSGISYEESRPSNGSYVVNYTVSCYQVPPRNKRKANNMSVNKNKIKRWVSSEKLVNAR